MKTKKLFLMMFMFKVCFNYAQTTTPIEHNGTVSATNTSVSNIVDNTNTLFGANAMPTNTLGGNLVQNWSKFISNAKRNTAFGQRALRYNIDGYDNTAIGVSALDNSTNDLSTTGGGNGNSALGRSALIGCNGSYNTAVGANCGLNPFSGGWNGTNTLFTGSGNTFLGANIRVNNLALSNTVIIGDGGFNTNLTTTPNISNHRIYIHSNGYTGIGLGNDNIPLNRLELNGGVANTSGLRFRSYTSSATIIAPTTDTKFLTLNTLGDVVLRNLPTLLTSSCTTTNFIPKSTGATTMTCSQIYDDGNGVGIATTGPFTFTVNTLITNVVLGQVPQPLGIGTAKLKVKGITWSDGFYAASDKKFKKDIKPIENALKSIEAIDGKTYLWDIEKNKEMNFDNGGHSGFIAQELEKVLPHLVATGSDGFKAVNYMELLPYLVEAIKEQQVQINELKVQVNDNFKTQNGDLLTLENTKIISVSPNPSNDVILVSMNIEKVVQNAKLLVHDINGLVLSTLNINERDTNITKTLQKDNFGKGIYIVSLVINGKSIDTKKIIFN